MLVCVHPCHSCAILFVYHFSYLAIVAGLASEADFIFIPEEPAPINWQDKLCRKLLQVVECTIAIFSIVSHLSITRE